MKVGVEKYYVIVIKFRDLHVIVNLPEVYELNLHIVAFTFHYECYTG